MSESQTPQELKKLLAVPLIEPVGGKNVSIQPFRFGDLHAVTVIALALFDDVVMNAKPDLLALLEKHGDRIRALVAFSTREPLEWIVDLPIPDGITLAEKMFEVNQDFFVQTLPKLIALGSQMQRPIPGKSKSSGPAPDQPPSPDVSESGPEPPTS